MLVVLLWFCFDSVLFHLQLTQWPEASCSSNLSGFCCNSEGNRFCQTSFTEMVFLFEFSCAEGDKCCSAGAPHPRVCTYRTETLMPLCTVTSGGCRGVGVMVIVNIWLSRRLLCSSWTKKWKTSVTGWFPVSNDVTYLLMGTQVHRNLSDRFSPLYDCTRTDSDLLLSASKSFFQT